MKKFINTLPALFCMAALWVTLSTCVDSDLWQQSSQTTHTDFSVAVAQSYFEHRVKMLSAATRSLDNEIRSRVTFPGDFTPLWNQAVASCESYLECYDVPIESEYRFKGIYSEWTGGKAKAHIVNVHQKLVIVRNKTTGGRGVYILTLVPDADYDKKHPREVYDLFVNCGDKHGFSGIAFYSVPVRNNIMGVYRYKNGKLVERVFLKGTQSEREEKAAKARVMLQDIRLKWKPKISTRSFGEDDGWWNEDSDFNFEIPDIEITPDSDSDYDWGIPTDEEWMDETRPGGVDYEEEPQGEDYDEDEEHYGTKDDSENDDLSQVLNQVEPYFEKLGINIDNYKIQTNKETCLTPARTLPDNTIELCQRFFDFSKNDQFSILWHEIYHIDNGHNKPMEYVGGSHSFSEKDVPPEILKGLEVYIKWEFVGNYISDELMEEYKKEFLTEHKLATTEWYENEVKTYEEELKMGEMLDDFNLSEPYQEMVDFMHWKYTELSKL